MLHRDRVHETGPGRRNAAHTVGQDSSRCIRFDVMLPGRCGVLRPDTALVREGGLEGRGVCGTGMCVALSGCERPCSWEPGRLEWPVDRAGGAGLGQTAGGVRMGDDLRGDGHGGLLGVRAPRSSGGSAGAGLLEPCLRSRPRCTRLALRRAADATSPTSAADVRPLRAPDQPVSVKAACAAARISSESGEPLVARDRASAPNRVQRRTRPSRSSPPRKSAKSATPSV